jgi:hypothetical protein
MEQFPHQNNIETVANYEGNATELLFGRLHTEKIRQQIIDLIYQDEQSGVGGIVESLEVDADGNVVFDDSGEPKIKERKPFIPLTKEEVEQRYDATVKKIESATEIEFVEASHHLPTQERMVIGAIAPWSGKAFTPEQMSIIEAHEKGHEVRPYMGEFFQNYFHRGFDFDAVPYEESESSIFKKALPPEEQEKTVAEIREMFFDYLKSPNELAERMSQLKNYFGMKGDDQFTVEHLEYARNHYVQDTDMDNGMTQFFQAITPGKTEAFIQIINSAGI